MRSQITTLITLLVGIGAVRVREVDVAVGLRHNAPYRVPALSRENKIDKSFIIPIEHINVFIFYHLANYVRVIGV